MLATDGLWEVMSNAEVVAFVADYRLASHEAMSAADALSWEAQQRWKAGGEQVGRGQHRPDIVTSLMQCADMLGGHAFGWQCGARKGVTASSFVAAAGSRLAHLCMILFAVPLIHVKTICFGHTLAWIWG